jgi:hypothetical protein
MTEILLSAFAGAAAALLLGGALRSVRQHDQRWRLAQLCLAHLERIQFDLLSHVRVDEAKASFGETQYHEAAVGHFLYDLLTSNMVAFTNPLAFAKTVDFFHHYKVNMSTVRSRLDRSDTRSAQLTKGTFENLLERLGQAIDELRSMRRPRPYRLISRFGLD